MAKQFIRMLFGTGLQDEEAVQELLRARIPCKFVGPIEDERTPQLIHGSVRFYGLEGIREFVRGWNHRNQVKK